MKFRRWLLLASAIVLALWLSAPFVIGRLYGHAEGPGQFGDLFGAVNSLFTGLALIGVIFTLLQQQQQLAEMREQFLAEHERWRLDSTFQVIDGLRPALKKFSLFLDSITGHRQNLKPEHIDKLKQDVKQRANLHDNLEQLEDLALALNIGLYDDDLVFRLTGPFLTNLWARCEPYIRDFRHEWPTVCVEFEQLAARYSTRAKSQYGTVPVRHLPKD